MFKAILLLLLLFLSTLIINIKNPAFAISFGFFLFLEILLEVLYTSKHRKS
ncbi:MAG: hypothetical protein ACPL1A_02705 [Candidatus Kapaibacteriota bacterium]